MAIFIYFPDIAGDAKDQGYKKYSAEGESAWFIRAKSFNFNFTAPDHDEGDQDSGAGAAAGGAANRSLGAGGRGATSGGGTASATRDVASNVNSISITKCFDYASPSFADAVANKSGADSKWQGYSKATIYVTSSQREVFLMVEMTGITVKGYQVGVSSSDEGTSTEETVDLKYKSVKWVYKETNTKGIVEFTSDKFKWSEPSS